MAEIALVNIHRFVTQVLQRAHANTDWDEDSVRKALQWAQYCNELCRRCEDQPEKRRLLNEALVKLFSDIPECFTRPLTVEYLQNATEELCIALLQNPKLSKEGMVCIIDWYRETGKKEEFIEMCGHLTKPKATAMVSQGLQDFSRRQTSPWSVDQTLLILRLKSIKFEEKLAEKLCLLATRHLDTILQILSAQTDSLLTTELRSSVSKWLLNYVRHSNLVWQCPPPLLSAVAAANYEFYKVYINFLRDEVETLAPCYTEGTGCRWNQRVNLPASLQYDDLVNNFTELLNKNGAVESATKLVLNEMSAKSSNGLAWIHIALDCEKRLIVLQGNHGA